MTNRTKAWEKMGGVASNVDQTEQPPYAHLDLLDRLRLQEIAAVTAALRDGWLAPGPRAVPSGGQM